ncbi:MAG TPA: hypothetical protein VGP63_23985 [Planctomycetaceae bacterium]|jgi:hypothetical protein|nr:hypothetical protein [Planctomycetaceae bacterium]
MPDPLIHFYATAAEIADWLCDWVSRYELHCVIGRHPPTVIVSDIPREDRAGVLAVLHQHTSVFMNMTPIDTNVDHLSRLWNANPGMLRISLPHYTSRAIRYGLFGTGTTDRTSLKTWRKLARDFFRRTSSGLWGVFPSTRRKKYDPEVRYTDGAADLWRGGGRLLGAGNDTWHVEEPQRIANGPVKSDAIFAAG